MTTTADPATAPAAGRRTRLLDRLSASPMLFAMLHLKGDDPADADRRARHELEIYAEQGVDAVIVENYFGHADAVERTLSHLADTGSELVYGVNLLDDDALGFALAARYGAHFIQLDSVAGHLPPEEDQAFATQLAEWRAATDAAVLGGVRFKYQPVRSGNDVATDLRLGMARADAIVVTGDGTGLETPLEKIAQFRAVLGGFPLIVGAGVTAGNCAAQLAEADGAIVGSTLKDTRRDDGDVDATHVAELVARFRSAS